MCNMRIHTMVLEVSNRRNIKPCYHSTLFSVPFLHFHSRIFIKSVQEKKWLEFISEKTDWNENTLQNERININCEIQFQNINIYADTSSEWNAFVENPHEANDTRNVASAWKVATKHMIHMQISWNVCDCTLHQPSPERFQLRTHSDDMPSSEAYIHTYLSETVCSAEKRAISLQRNARKREREISETFSVCFLYKIARNWFFSFWCELK